jgi:signal recognition particle receptor subunit beta
MTTLHVFVTGPRGSGKSQFLAALGDPANYWLDDEAGLEYRHLVVDDTLEVYLFCAVDASRFDRLLGIPQRDLLGYIVMVDSTNPDTWGEARIMMANCRGYALLPTLIAANKQDLPGAATPERVGASLGMDNMTGVQPCVATDPQSVRNVFLQLLYLVKREIDRLDALIAEIERMMAQNEPTQE